MKIKDTKTLTGKKVRIKSTNDIDIAWRDEMGVILAEARQLYIDGFKKKYKTEYIVQFKKPLEWSYFKRKEFEVLNDQTKRSGKRERENEK